MEAGDITAVLARASGGDEEAFSLLVHSHARTAFRLAYRLTGDERDAEDVVQESFIRAYRQINRFEARSNFATDSMLITGPNSTSRSVGSPIRSALVCSSNFVRNGWATL